MNTSNVKERLERYLKDTIAMQAKMICDLHEKLADKKTSCLSN